MKKYYKCFIDTIGMYSASDRLGCFDEKKNQLNKKYTDIFLNVLSLICYVPDYQKNRVELSYIKRDKILSLTSDEICNNYGKACKGIDRACFFLQVRCGIRKIQEINYNLMLVLLGYILSNDSFYENENIINILEAWYWCSIFSGRYDKDQSENIIEDINHVLSIIKNPEDKNWIQDMKKKCVSYAGLF
ncbi:hypothetical protein DWX81_07775 [Roseburia inulinivorans]|uniref:hypothetical protein n=1 Tax=Roseburia inulinivorans TaxID=360807 RepID=UPI000E53E4E4|nr:hypothetical protein [Roseburia inulinivorans]RGS67198.1 hypothetical protein DWX81_07775 [Roseburia inulinivorans]